ncbi:MAG: (deoxy)nucleoside triphosphate pyrophosphohydrolase [Bacteroidales bacterium]
MKHIEVVAAVIVMDGLYLATQRADGEFMGLWEFPGGKIGAGESHCEALCREIMEELNVEVSIDKHICKSEWEYPSFVVTIHSYMCSIIKGEVEMRVHSDARWLDVDSLYDVEWIPADVEIVNRIRL